MPSVVVFINNARLQISSILNTMLNNKSNFSSTPDATKHKVMSCACTAISTNNIIALYKSNRYTFYSFYNFNFIFSVAFIAIGQFAMNITTLHH